MHGIDASSLMVSKLHQKSEGARIRVTMDDFANVGNIEGGPFDLVYCVFNTFFAIGWLGMTWLYPAEIVPLKIRAPANALSTAVLSEIAGSIDVARRAGINPATIATTNRNTAAPVSDSGSLGLK